MHLPLHEHNEHRPAVVQVDGSMLSCLDRWRDMKLLSVGVLGDLDRVYFADFDKDRLEEMVRSAAGFAALQSRKNVLWIADGAPYIWKMQERLCPNSKGLLDFYHVMQHACECAKIVLDDEEALVDMFRNRVNVLLCAGRIDELFDELKECTPHKPRSKSAKRYKKALMKFLGYLSTNRSRLNYREFLDNGWPIGSGAIESAHRHVIQKRMKQAGMHWSVSGARVMAGLRALYASVGPKKLAKLLHAA